AGRSLPGKRRAWPDKLPGRGKSGLHRTRWWVTPTVRKDRESATESIPPCENPSRGKGEKVGGRESLNVRAHQQPGDRLARQTPPGARPNKRAGLVRPATTLG